MYATCLREGEELAGSECMRLDLMISKPQSNRIVKEVKETMAGYAWRYATWVSLSVWTLKITPGN